MNMLISITDTYDSYQSLITFYEDNMNKFLSDINLELRNFFAANMSAALGSILDLFISDLNDIHFDYISPDVEAILQKNDYKGKNHRRYRPSYFERIYQKEQRDDADC